MRDAGSPRKPRSFASTIGPERGDRLRPERLRLGGFQHDLAAVAAPHAVWVATSTSTIFRCDPRTLHRTLTVSVL